MVDVWIGWLGLILLVVSWVPGALRTIKARRTDEHPFFLVVYAAATVFLLAYSVQLGDGPFVLLNILALMLVGVQIYFLAARMDLKTGEMKKMGARKKR